MTVGDWLAHWLVSRVSPAASTMRSYAALERLYLAPYLGPVLLGELSAAHVQAMFTAIIRHNRRQWRAGAARMRRYPLVELLRTLPHK